MGHGHHRAPPAEAGRLRASARPTTGTRGPDDRLRDRNELGDEDWSGEQSVGIVGSCPYRAESTDPIRDGGNVTGLPVALAPARRARRRPATPGRVLQREPADPVQ